MIMSEALESKLRQLGWRLDRVTWGVVTAKGFGWVEMDSPWGKTHFIAPFVPVPEGIRVKVGEQCAVVRQG